MTTTTSSTAARPLSRFCAVICLLLTLFMGGAAAAQEDLYGPTAPADVAWVRVLNASDDDPVNALLSGQELTVAAGEATAYLAVMPGELAVTVAELHVDAELQVGSFTTIAVLPDRLETVNETGLRDISRGLLGLMNLSAVQALSLQTPEGDIVVQDVAPGTSAAIAVSEAVTALQVMDGGESVATIPEQTFERGHAYTVVVLNGDSGPVAILLAASAD